MLNGLDLFSGIGGISLALSPWVKTKVYCEIDRYSQAVLLSRMSCGELRRAPIWDDVSTLKRGMLPEIDIISGGFPCQDLSVAGNGTGLAGKRSGLYFEVERLVGELRPAFVFLENVLAIRTRGADRIVRGLSDLGYDCRWTVVSAAELGAPHIRKRWFLLAHAHGTGLEGQRDGAECPEEEKSEPPRHCETMDNALCGRHRAQTKEVLPRRDGSFDASWWETEPSVGRVVDGIPNRVDRIKGLGNAVVPLQAREAFKRLSGMTQH